MEEMVTTHIHIYIYTVTVTAELMSNDTKFARVGEFIKRKKKERKPFHTLDRVLRVAKKMREKN